MLSDANQMSNVATRRGLNPCSNGICSLTATVDVGEVIDRPVLILVLMEYAL